MFTEGKELSLEAHNFEGVIPRAASKDVLSDVAPVDAEDFSRVLVPVPYRKVLHEPFLNKQLVTFGRQYQLYIEAHVPELYTSISRSRD